MYYKLNTSIKNYRERISFFLLNLFDKGLNDCIHF